MNSISRVLAPLLLCSCIGGGSTPTSAITAPALAKVGEALQLDGTKSVDKNKTGLAYAWRFISIPAGASPGFSDPTSPAPTFAPDREGTYVIGLVVRSGTVTSTSAQATITVSGSCFTIGDTATGNQGEKIPLATTATDAACADAQATFQWSIAQRPTGSTAAVVENGFDPNFVPDLSGAYTLVYSVKYGAGDFLAPKSVAVTVTPCGPAADIQASTQRISVGETLHLSALQAVTAPACVHGVESTHWQLLAAPASASATSYLISSSGASSDQSEVSSLSAAFLAAFPGTYTIGLTVTDDHGLIDHKTLDVSVSPTVTQYDQGSNFGYALENDAPVVVYQDGVLASIMLATYDPVQLTWGIETVFTDAVSPPTNPAIANLGSTPCVSYFHMGSMVFTCKTGGQWPTSGTGFTSTGPTALTGSVQLVPDSKNDALGLLWVATTVLFSNCSNVSTPDCLGPTSFNSTSAAVAFSAAGLPRIVYTDATTSPASLKFLACTNAQCSTPDAASAYSVTDTTITAGTQMAIANNGSDTFGILFLDNTNSVLRYATCNVTKCGVSPTEIVQQGGYMQSLALTFNATGTAQALWTNTSNGNSNDLVRGVRAAAWVVTPQGMPLTWLNENLNDFNIGSGLSTQLHLRSDGSPLAVYFAQNGPQFTTGLRLFDRKQ